MEQADFNCLIDSNMTFREIMRLFPEENSADIKMTKSKLDRENTVIFEMDNSGSKLIVYDNGYYYYMADGHYTIYKINYCYRPLRYFFSEEVEGELTQINLDKFMDKPFCVRLICEGENRLISNIDSYWQKKNYTYDNVIDSIDLEEPDSDFQDDVMDQIVLKEAKEAIQKASTKLTPRQREAVNCYYFHNMTYQQIAKRLNCSRQSVNECVRRALVKMRKYTPRNLYEAVVQS